MLIYENWQDEAHNWYIICSRDSKGGGRELVLLYSISNIIITNIVNSNLLIKKNNEILWSRIQEKESKGELSMDICCRTSQLDEKEKKFWTISPRCTILYWACGTLTTKTPV